MRGVGKPLVAAFGLFMDRTLLRDGGRRPEWNALACHSLGKKMGDEFPRKECLTEEWVVYCLGPRFLDRVMGLPQCGLGVGQMVRWR